MVILRGGPASFRRREERGERQQSFLRTVGQIARHKGVREVVQLRRVAGGQEGIPTLLKRNALGVQAMFEPVMLIEAHTREKAEVGADANEHAAPLAIEQIEIVLVHPAAVLLQMPPSVLADRDQNARGLARLEDDDDLIGGRAPEVAVDEGVEAAGGCLDHKDIPFPGPAKPLSPAVPAMPLCGFPIRPLLVSFQAAASGAHSPGAATARPPSTRPHVGVAPFSDLSPRKCRADRSARPGRRWLCTDPRGKYKEGTDAADEIVVWPPGR
jgi:hypothetical protein